MIDRKGLMLFAFAGLLTLSSFLMMTDHELAESIKRGEQVYTTHCASCHMEDGSGMQGTFPPLAQSDYLMADIRKAIKVTKEGAQGEMTVNGTTYYGFMPAQNLNEKELADVMNYIRNSWGNKGNMVTVEDVQAALQ